MKLEDVREGMKVRTYKRLRKTAGFLVVQKHLDARKPDTEGVVTGYVPGHGGDVYWVTHNDGSTGAYSFKEFGAA